MPIPWFLGLSAPFWGRSGAAVSAAEDVVSEAGRRDACTTNLADSRFLAAPRSADGNSRQKLGIAGSCFERSEASL